MLASAWVEMICVILGASGSRLLTAQILQEDLFFRSARSTLDLRGAQHAGEKAGKLCCVCVCVNKLYIYIYIYIYMYVKKEKS